MVMVEETYMPLTLFVPDLTDERFEEFCKQYSDFHLEYTADSELIIMPPNDPDTGARNAALTQYLRQWAIVDKRGIVTDSSGGFILPNHARRSPDAAWTIRGRFGLRSCPEFVVELLSPSDSRKKTHEKMLEWIVNGAELGWLIDPFHRTVTIYRSNGDVEVRKGILEIAGEGPINGFTLDLREIWNV